MTTGLLTARAAVSESISETPINGSESSTRLNIQRPAESAAPLQRFPLLFAATREAEFVGRLQRLFPEDCTRSVALACAAQQHQVKTPGGVNVWLGEAIDWQRDPHTGRLWQERGARANRTCRNSTGSDPRRVWALSRSHHLVALALASHLETRVAYANEVELQIRSWIAQNRIGQGINWSNSSECAIRALNWLLAFQLVEQRWPREPEFRELLLKHLTQTGAYIRTHLQEVCHGYNDYHYLANLVGLLYLGELRSDLRGGREWRNFAVAELETECLQQFDSDGLLRQSSLAYHGFATELLCHALLLESRCDWSFSEAFKEHFGRMLSVLASYREPEGRIASWGDSEELRLYNWCDSDLRDFGNVVAIGRRLLANRQDSDSVSLVDEFLLFGGSQRAVGRADLEQVGKSFHLEAGGLCRLHSTDWQVDFFADTRRTNPTGTHQHNDLLSLTARFLGQEVLIDPGTFSYSESEAGRREFRGTAAHNTVTIDGQEQRRTVAKLPFVLRPDATAHVALWRPDELRDLVVAEHDGYRRLGDPVRHRRALCLDKESQVLLIKDELRGAARHRVELNFQLGELRLEPLDSRNLLLRLPQGQNLLLVLLSAELQFTIGSAWRAPFFDQREPALRVSAAAELDLPATLLCAVAPCSDSEPENAHTLIRSVVMQLGWQ